MSDRLFCTFQCSSASRKFLNTATRWAKQAAIAFQCSSASRKFLNLRAVYDHYRYNYVSVLFSEPKIPQFRVDLALAESHGVSVLFSEPKIPQSQRIRCHCRKQSAVSVLFSEPKIPQSREAVAAGLDTRSFSALQRAENSSIFAMRRLSVPNPGYVSVLFSEPKIPQCTRTSRFRSDV